jgi:PemK-like, MazF-like toxin of type II toxin-antitoxin system
MALNLRLIGNTVRTALRLLDRLSGSAAGSSGTPQAPTSVPPRGKKQGKTAPAGPKAASARPGTAPRRVPAAGAAGTGREYAGDFHGTATVRYAPSPNGLPEPGEVVWAWVPYEEDYLQGKDRPVLLVGNAGGNLLGIMLTSKDHDRDGRRDEDYMDVGTGAWDRQLRPSEAKLDRILQIDPADIRREGAILDAGRFNLIAAELRSRHGWS